MTETTHNQTGPAGPAGPQEIISVAATLVQLMKRETAALLEMRTADIAPLQAEKGALTAELTALLSKYAPLPDALPIALAEEFAATLPALDQAVRENERAITAARNAHQTLLSVIVDAVADGKAENLRYTANGKQLRTNPATVRKPAVSLTLDRRL